MELFKTKGKAHVNIDDENGRQALYKAPESIKNYPSQRNDTR